MWFSKILKMFFENFWTAEGYLIVLFYDLIWFRITCFISGGVCGVRSGLIIFASAVNCELKNI